MARDGAGGEIHQSRWQRGHALPYLARVCQAMRSLWEGSDVINDN